MKLFAIVAIAAAALVATATAATPTLTIAASAPSVTYGKTGSFTATVTAGLDLKGKTLSFQRYATVRKRWVQVKKVTLTTSAPATKPTVISSAAFKARVAKRARVRLVLTKTQAAPCNLPANSNVVRN